MAQTLGGFWMQLVFISVAAVCVWLGTGNIPLGIATFFGLVAIAQ